MYGTWFIWVTSVFVSDCDALPFDGSCWRCSWQIFRQQQQNYFYLLLWTAQVLKKKIVVRVSPFILFTEVEAPPSSFTDFITLFLNWHSKHTTMSPHRSLSLSQLLYCLYCSFCLLFVFFHSFLRLSLSQSTVSQSLQRPFNWLSHLSLCPRFLSIFFLSHSVSQARLLFACLVKQTIQKSVFRKFSFRPLLS